MRDNVAAWGRWMLRPHVLRDMSDVRTSTTVLGTAVDAPILVAPTAMHRFVCDDGELATATRRGRGEHRSTSCRWRRRRRSRTSPRPRPTAPAGRRCTCCATAVEPAPLAERAGDAGYRAIVASVDGAAVPRRSRLAGGALVPPDSFRFPNLAGPRRSPTTRTSWRWCPTSTRRHLRRPRAVRRSGAGSRSWSRA